MIDKADGAELQTTNQKPETNNRKPQTKNQKPETYKWWVVAMLWFVCFFNYADRQAIFSVFELLKSEMHLSDVQLGIVGASFMWVYAAIGPLAGLVGDRINRKTLIIAGLVFWSLITIATALSTKYSHLVLFRALEGFGEAFYFPASMSLISDYHGPGTRSRAMSIHQSSVYAGTIAGGSVAGVLGQHYGWRSSFYLFGSLGILLGIFLLVVLREPARASSTDSMPEPRPSGRGGEVKNALKTVRELFAIPMVRILTAVFIGANFVAMIFLTWMPSFLYRKFNLSLAMSGISATAYLQIASVLGVLSGGVLADRLAKGNRGGRMLTQAIGLTLGVPFIFLAGWTLSVPVVIVALTGFGYFKGLYDANIWASLHDVVPPERRASAVGFMNSLGWIGGGVAPVAIAAASERFGMSACISANSVIYLLVAGLLFYGIRRHLWAPHGNAS
ncbi:MAG TPA: MFS transporter [Blastocatellia bacterium]|nr:MFS transporter [Blastocatellia bacterium]